MKLKILGLVLLLVMGKGVCGTDTTPPGKICDLITSGGGPGYLNLIWTAPSDDSGNLSRYEIRHSTSPIVTQADWDAARTLASDNYPRKPMKSGTKQCHTVIDLKPETTYYFAIKAYDAALNPSSLSNCAKGKTLPTTLL
jgi:hypothetical protein